MSRVISMCQQKSEFIFVVVRTKIKTCTPEPGGILNAQSVSIFL